MAAIISQLMLPMVLALIMLVMGLNLQLSQFKQLSTQAKATLLGLCLQMLLLPMLALLITLLLPLSTTMAAGLILVALCPGGATSNLFSYLAKGDLALSIALTTICSLLIPFSLPVLFNIYLYIAAENQSLFSLPLNLVIKQLFAITFIPITIGMSINYYWPQFNKRFQTRLRRLVTVSMLIVIMLLIISHVHLIGEMLSFAGLAVLLLICLALIIAYHVSKLFLNSEAQQITIAFEVGIQNAAIAMFVAFSLLKQPELASLPLLYGLLMNVPAFGFIYYLTAIKKEG